MEDTLGHYYTLGEDETILEGVTAAVAAITDRDVTELPALYEVIDPECLETLFETGAGERRVAFKYAGCSVLVNGKGRVAVAQDGEQSESPLGECAHCGETFELDVDYPIETRQIDGEVTFFAFCDSECKENWEGHHRQSADHDV